VSEKDADSKTVGQGRLKKAVLWLAGSALLGSAALALWNRRTLSSIREAEKQPPKPPQTRDEDGIY
jgi:hypothetical protein